MSAQVSWAVFYSSQQPSQIGPTADFDGATLPSPIFSMTWGFAFGGMGDWNYKIFGLGFLMLKINFRENPNAIFNIFFCSVFEMWLFCLLSSYVHKKYFCQKWI